MDFSLKNHNIFSFVCSNILCQAFGYNVGGENCTSHDSHWKTE